MGEGEGQDDERREDAPGRVRTDEAAASAAAAEDDEPAGARGGAGTRSRRASTRAAAAAKKDDSAPPPAADDADADADADADGEIDDSVLTNTSPHAALPSRVPDYAKPDRIPLVGSDGADLGGATSDDVFVSTGLDGTVLLWDRRVGEGKGVVRRWDGYEAPGGERGKKEGASGGRCTSVRRLFLSLVYSRLT